MKVAHPHRQSIPYLLGILTPFIVALILLGALLNLFAPPNAQADLPLSAQLAHKKRQPAPSFLTPFPFSSQINAFVLLERQNDIQLLKANTLNGTNLHPDPDWVSDDLDRSIYTAWGDVDGDGDLDLAVANSNLNYWEAGTRIYLNDNGTLQTNAIWTANYEDETRFLDWGDMDGDGDLDLAVANIDRYDNNPSPNRIYRNDGLSTDLDGNLILLLEEAWVDPHPDYDSGAVAWGDYNGDGRLDLAVGNGGWIVTEPSFVYRNDGLDGNQNIILTPVFTTPVAANTTAIAWGDMDNDGFLDLALGNYGQPNRVYENWFGTFQYIPGLLGWEPDPGLDSTYSIQWGDINLDGYLDLAVGNYSHENQIFLNNGGTLNATATWTDTLNSPTIRISLGDADNDGDLDLAVANIKKYGSVEDPVTQVFVNELSDSTTVSMTLGWEAAVDAEQITGVAWGDVDGDGDLDLATSIWPKPNLLYLNEAGGLRETAVFSDTFDPIDSIAWGDIDNDGDMDLAVTESLYQNQNGTLYWEKYTAMDGPVAWGDVNRDGYLDIAAGSEIWLNIPGPGGRTFAYDSDYGLGFDALDVAWADANNDGYLDLAIAGNDTRVFFNDGAGMLSTISPWQPKDPFPTTAVAWGDVDNDGDLDLALGSNVDGKNQVYLSDNGVLDETAAFTFGDENDAVWDLDWGDVDGDGDLDMAVAVQFKPNLVFLNDNGLIREEPDWSSADIDYSHSIAWGDVDGDGDLDLAVANKENKPDKVYLNVNGTLNAAPIWLSSDRNKTAAVAWGDMDGDGRFELATAASEGLYIYAGQGPLHPTRFGPETAVSITNLTNPLILFPGSTDILAPANGYAIPGIRSGQIPIQYKLTSQNAAEAHFVRAFYSPDGGGKWLPAVPVSGTQTTALASSPTGVTHVFDWDVQQSQFFGQSDNMVFRIEAYFGASPATSDPGRVGTYNYANMIPGPYQQPYVAAQTYPFRVRGTQIRVMDETNTPISDALVYRLPNNQILGAKPLVNALNIPFLTDSSGYLQGRGQLAPSDQLVALHPIAYGGATEKALNFDGFDDYIDFGVVNQTAVLTNDFTVSAWVKLDRIGGIQRIISHARNNSVDGFGFGLINDGLRFTTYGVKDYDSRYISLKPNEWYHVAAVMSRYNYVSFYVNGIYQETVFNWGEPGLPNTDDKLLLGAISNIGGNPDNPFLFEYLNGSINEVRIWDGYRTTAQIQAEMNETLPQTDHQFLIGYWPMTEGAGNFIGDLSDNNITGELGGLNASHPNNREPTWVDEDVPQDPTYVVYQTSAAPTETGLEMKAVPSNLGIVTLNVMPTQTLTLFNLDVSLEWDSRNDPNYLDQLTSDLQRTSQILFDLTNGQAALGNVTIFQDKDNWLDADVIVYATNSHRPNANLGGIVQEPFAEMVLSPTSTQKITVENAYLPGQIRMGATWNRFGNSSGSLGEDWPRALAHEIGHYGFFLLDNYIGIRNNVLVETVCRGSAMYDAYVEREFLTTGDWSGECLDTLAAKTTGRSDWQTISTYYGWMTATAVTAGPTNLPLDVTEIQFANQVTESETLAAPFFGLLDENSAPLVFGESEAQAYLYKTANTPAVTDDDLIALGSPNRDLIQARGAEPGDRLCVYSLNPTRIGCHEVDTQEQPFTVSAVSDWPPQIVATTENSRTFVIAVSNLSNVNSLGVQIYPVFGTASDEFITTGLGGQTTVSLTVTLTDPSPGGYVRLWVPGSNPYKETVTQFYLGGGWNVNRPGLNVNRPGLNVNRPGLNVNRPGLNAPVASSDGQVIIFSLENLFDDIVTHSLQSLASLPDLDPWLTPVGQAYRFTADGDLPQSSISFYYLQRDVPAGYEDNLAIYYQANGSSEWERLATVPDNYRNLASAALQSEGTYVLAVTIVTPQLSQGWNQFAYPDTNAREVMTALASIDGDYTSVYKWHPTGVPAWTLYDNTVLPAFQDLVNDLPALEPLQSYWIYALTDTTAYIGVPTLQNNILTNLSLPPATYYGEVVARDDFTPTLGMTIEAQIDGNVCGTSLVTNTQAGLSYKIQVAADNGNNCGTNNKNITFVVDGVTMPNIVTWDNSQANYLPLNGLFVGGEPETSLYLPLIMSSSANSAPDLVVTNLAVTSSNVEVVIQNQGTAPVPVGGDFWVDVYLDPNPPPTAVNDIWQNHSTEGLVWGVVGSALPLDPGESLTLSVNDSYYRADESNFSGSVVVGTAVYAQVDSANANTNYGAVLENHEINGSSYNNIFGPVISTATMNQSANVSLSTQIQTNNLPPRK